MAVFHITDDVDRWFRVCNSIARSRSPAHYLQVCTSRIYRRRDVIGNKEGERGRERKRRVAAVTFNAHLGRCAAVRHNFYGLFRIFAT